MFMKIKNRCKIMQRFFYNWKFEFFFSKVLTFKVALRKSGSSALFLCPAIFE